jgi:hypothetical protein
MRGARVEPYAPACSPPPCGEGLGVGVQSYRDWVQSYRDCDSAHAFSLDPPPQPSPARREGAHRPSGRIFTKRRVGVLQ